MKQAIKLENLGSLITYKDDQGRDIALGYLFDFTGHGIFSPDGKVEVSKENAEMHNRLLGEAELKGLDENCQVGQGGTFYFGKGKDGDARVTTWMGTIVSENIVVTGRVRQTVFFRRNGKRFRGILRKDADCFNFRRVS